MPRWEPEVRLAPTESCTSTAAWLQGLQCTALGGAGTLHKQLLGAEPAHDFLKLYASLKKAPSCVLCKLWAAQTSPKPRPGPEQVHPGRQLQSRLTTTKSGHTVVVPRAQLHARLTLVHRRASQ